MSRKQPLPKPLSTGPMSLKQARELGVTPSRLRASDLATPFRGVRTPQSQALEPLQLARALATILTPGQFFSHQTAALIWGMPLPWGLQHDPTVHVAVFKPRRSPRRAGVIGHPVAPGAATVREFHGLPVASPASTWTQLAAVLTLYELVAAGDYLLRGIDELEKYGMRPVYTPLASLSDLESATARSRHVGAAKLREALGRVRPGVESPKETQLRLTLVDAGLPEPEINRNIYSPTNEFLARADLSYPEYTLIVEFDGDQHRHSKYQFDRDIDRIARLEEHGWRVVRIRESLLRDNPAEVVRRVRVALQQRGWE